MKVMQHPSWFELFLPDEEGAWVVAGTIIEKYKMSNTQPQKYNHFKSLSSDLTTGNRLNTEIADLSSIFDNSFMKRFEYF